MNQHCKKLALLLAILAAKVCAQNDTELYAIPSVPVEITYNKTVNLIFSYPIKSVDMGSRDVLAQKAKGVENVLQLKAARKSFPQTNLTVIAGDGQLYSFLINYAEEPMQLNLELIKGNVKSGAASFVAGSYNEKHLKHTAQQALSAKGSGNIDSDSKGGIRLTLAALFIKNDVLYCRFSASNQSNISYQLEGLTFLIADKNHVKRTAMQQTEIQPLYYFPPANSLLPDSYQEIVVALPKFTMPSDKRLIIECMEKNGARNVTLSIKNKSIVKAAAL